MGTEVGLHTSAPMAEVEAGFGAELGAWLELRGYQEVRVSRFICT